MKILQALILLLTAGVASGDVVTPAPVTPLKADEVIQFFASSAWFDTDAGAWQVPIHGWVYEPENSNVRKDVIAKALQKSLQLETSATTAANFDRRINLMIADNERGKRVTILLAGRLYTLPKSRSNGHFQSILSVPALDASRASSAGVLHFETITAETPSRVFQGQVQLIAPRGISVISDIDDTIKISMVTDHQRLFDHAFFQDFAAVPGMAERYSEWACRGAAVHFVSSSPWQLYAPLAEFAAAAGFPAATVNLKSVRFRDRSFFKLFKKGTETKPDQIMPILNRYPERKFILVGDNGEQDPEVYAAMMRKYPHQVLRAYIRNVSGAATADERMRTAFAGISPAKWRLFVAPDSLELPAL